MWGSPVFIFVLLGSTLFDFFIAKQIAAVRERPLRRKQLLLYSIFFNVGLLAYFKYANFFVENVNSLLSQMGLSPVEWTAVVLPIGISFFTFQKMSYVIDVYRGTNQPLYRFSDLVLYILLFPQLIAGPIVRYNEIAAQLQDRRSTEILDYRLAGLFRFSIGLAKKMLIANPIGELADMLFAIPAAELTTGQAWLGALAYAFQIYFDFSGYSDMAIGLGLMMGFTFPENFNAPYIAQSITDFWRRWHITLSSWMRDYLYIPLGGNRVSAGRRYFNLWIVFIISGLWHGAAWTFVVWGIYHGFFLILDRLFLVKLFGKIGRLPRMLLTFMLTLVGWVIFRSESLSEALAHIGAMLAWKNSDWSFQLFTGVYPFYIPLRFQVILAIAALFSFLPAISIVEKQMNRVYEVQTSLWALLWRLAVAVVLLFVCMTEVLSTGVNPFIYFRF